MIQDEIGDEQVFIIIFQSQTIKVRFRGANRTIGTFDCLIEFQYFENCPVTTTSYSHLYKRMSYDSVERPHQLLVVVIDINPNQLLFARQPGSLTQLMNSVMTLLNQHMMLHTTNKVIGV